jgi:type VI secretion system protein ImpM
MLAPGFFGKLPCRGDFIGRRMPPGFQQTWETWLASLVVSGRQALADEWPDAWLTAPLWHFAFGSALVPPHGAVGVLVASVDRVGRFFPFSIIATAEPGNRNEAALLDWSRAAEALILGALDDDADPDTLDAALAGLGPPNLTTSPGHRSGQWTLELDGEWPDPYPDPLADRSRLPPGPEQSTWWCRGSERMAPLHFRCAGLPGSHTTEAMLTGAFDLPEG